MVASSRGFQAGLGSSPRGVVEDLRWIYVVSFARSHQLRCAITEPPVRAGNRQSRLAASIPVQCACWARSCPPNAVGTGIRFIPRSGGRILRCACQEGWSSRPVLQQALEFVWHPVVRGESYTLFYTAADQQTTRMWGLVGRRYGARVVRRTGALLPTTAPWSLEEGIGRDSLLRQDWPFTSFSPTAVGAGHAFFEMPR